MKLVLLALVTGVLSQGKAGKAAPPVASQAPTAAGKVLSAEEEKAKILAQQVSDVIANEREENGGEFKGTIIDLVLQSMNMKGNVTCKLSDRGFKTCVEGYQSQDCVFDKEAATFGGVNCIPYLSQCEKEFLQYCQAKVPNHEKCKAKDACSCADEPGCGWSRGHLMCLVGRPLVSCGDCSSMPRCGAIDCTKATRPCECVALGGTCGWSTSSWRCEAGKDTDCNECAEQVECGGPGVEVDTTGCPADKPSQLSPCSTVATCPYEKKCCERCAGQKQVCNSVKATCDGKFWELTTADLTCPGCEGYYYDDGYYSEAAPSAPTDITFTGLTATSVTLNWKAPMENFIAGTDGYSVAYAITNQPSDLSILNVTKKTSVLLSPLVPNTDYKVSILPVVTATEEVGEAAHSTFKTPAASKPTAAKGPAKAKRAKKATPKGKK